MDLLPYIYLNFNAHLKTEVAVAEMSCRLLLLMLRRFVAAAAAWPTFNTQMDGKSYFNFTYSQVFFFLRIMCGEIVCACACDYATFEDARRQIN